jgi:hypothetical protein
MTIHLYRDEKNLKYWMNFYAGASTYLIDELVLSGNSALGGFYGLLVEGAC